MYIIFYFTSPKIAEILRDKTMADQFMYIPNDVIQNFPFYRLHLVVETFDAELNEPTNQNPKVPKVVMPTNNKKLL